MRGATVLAAVAAALAVALAATSPAVTATSATPVFTDPRIKHVVVLMNENRALDHYLGGLGETRSDVDLCHKSSTDPKCSVPEDPTDPSSRRVPAGDGAIYVQPADPGHSVGQTHLQLFGFLPADGEPADSRDLTPNMTGFIESYKGKLATANVTDVPAEFIMEGFASAHVPVLSTLANEFAIFDGWFAGVPGPTEVNRAFAQSASSDGMGTNDIWREAFGLPQKTVYEQLDDAGHDWQVVFEDFPAAVIMGYTRKHLSRFHTLPTFLKQLKNGTLPAFTWMEPRYYDDWNQPARDQHPDHAVDAGELLMKEVYEAIRASPVWNETLFLITYDEHGGFFDHVPPPLCSNPDGKVSTDPPFNFTRLGLRVPAVAISPYVKAGTVVHSAANGTQYEHSSIPATMRKLFAPKQPFLNHRDAGSGTFDSALNLPVGQARTDCPTVLPVPPSHRAFGTLPPLDGNMPLSDLQRAFAVAAAAANGEMVSGIDDMTESQGARYVQDQVAKLLGWPRGHLGVASMPPPAASTARSHEITTDMAVVPPGKLGPGEQALHVRSWTGTVSTHGPARSFTAHMATLRGDLSQFGFQLMEDGCNERHNTSVTAKAFGCDYATNGGFFNFGGGCVGDVVIDGKSQQLPVDANTHAAVGILSNGSFAAGFMATPAVVEKFGFAQLISGNGWLIRDGAKYAMQSPDLDPTSTFFTEKAPRTGVGMCANGTLVVLQVDGEEDIKLGLDVLEFQDVFASLGVDQAINLDGGGSSVSYYDGKVISHPTCDDTPVRCERAVTTITCIKTH